MITHAAVKSAIKVSEVASPRALMISHLSSQQTDYLRAASILFGGDRSKTASFYGTDVIRIEDKIK